jgi:hypothetical protein
MISIDGGCNDIDYEDVGSNNHDCILIIVAVVLAVSIVII